MSKKENRKQNQWHLNVARYHLNAMVPDMIPREAVRTWTELMKHVEMLRIELEQREKEDDRVRGGRDDPQEPEREGRTC